MTRSPKKGTKSPKLLINLLGGFHAILSNGREVLISSRKGQSLLAYLALHVGQQHSRTKLAALLWSEYDDASARHSLRQALSGLRRLNIDEIILTANHNDVFLQGEAIQVDVAEFLKLSAKDDQQSLEQAVEMYVGDLLEGISIDDDRFEEWMTEQRHQIRERASQAYSKLVEIYRSDGKLHRAVDCTRQLLRIDPFDETIIRKRMALLARSGRGLEALRNYQEFSNLLQRELGVEPESETAELYLKIADGRISPDELDQEGTKVSGVSLLDAFRSLDGFVIWDEADRFVICNDKFREIFAPAADLLKSGVGWEEIMRHCILRGRFPQASSNPEQYLHTRAQRRRLGASEAPDTELDDGRCYRLTHRRTQAGALIVIFTDATDRKKREMALQRSHSRLQAVLGATPFGIEEVDLNGRIMFCNSVFSRLLGYEATELIGKLQSEFMTTPWIEKTKDARNRRRPRILAQYKTKSGAKILTSIDWDVIRDESGQPVGYFGIVMPRHDRG